MSTSSTRTQRAADLREFAAYLRQRAAEHAQSLEAHAASLEAEADTIDALPGLPCPVESMYATHALYDLLIGQGVMDDFLLDRFLKDGLAARRSDRVPVITERGLRELQRALWAYELDARTRKYDPSTGVWLMSEATQAAIQASARAARTPSGGAH